MNCSAFACCAALTRRGWQVELIEHCSQAAMGASGLPVGMLSPHFDHFFPDRPVDASHPDVLLDFNRCIMCELCVRASRDVDGKNVFALSGRGVKSHLVVNSESGRLADTDFAVTDRAAEVCPVGVILKKRQGFAVPIGERTYDKAPISQTGEFHGQPALEAEND